MIDAMLSVYQKNYLDPETNSKFDKNLKNTDGCSYQKPFWEWAQSVGFLDPIKEGVEYERLYFIENKGRIKRVKGAVKAVTALAGAGGKQEQKEEE